MVAFAPVQARTAAAEAAAQVGRLAAAGATHVILHAVGDGAALEQFAEMIARAMSARWCGDIGEAGYGARPDGVAHSAPCI